ncbi:MULTISPECIES: RBBP9/YdeN family alpha/beta hydrolase [Yersiniaceae]|uniref:RBBP9/YdeN family alpha/beta hydrolase n=1 Tax=Yersiniaceae TaxID=1903411 RepID=UPI000934EB31|nr:MULTISPECIES: alpha/beta hydrolase [Yersiniaceae]MDV5140288.1 alpha/beta hydrolase [Chimaeribacter arupi]PLR53593.1 serine hydrolase family protein [Chimaeribacter arupi]
MASKRLFIVHGFMAGPDHHWFGWLKKEAELLGMTVHIPAMPDPMAPDETAWLSALQAAVGEPDGDTWFVGHSLGCITILRYLDQQPPGRPAGGVIMVSGFSDAVPALPELEAFTRAPLDAAQLIRHIPQRIVVASLNDEIVPPALTLRLSQQLNAPFYGLPESGHFLDRDGFSELPLVAGLLRRLTAG